MLEGKTLSPILDNLLVVLDPPKTQIGMIHIPERGQRLEQWGKVLAVGNEVKNLCELDRVMSLKTGGTRIVVGGESYLILKERECLLVERGES